MFVILVVCMVLTAFAVYRFTTSNEQENFQNDFDADSRKVLEAIGESIDRTLASVDVLATLVVSHAKSSNSSWPYVTVPDFAVHGEKIRAVSNAVVIVLYPFVARDQRARWENYTAANNAWVNQSVHLQDGYENYYGPDLYNHYYTDYIYTGWDIRVNESDLYMPSWQSAPTVPYYAPYNWDILATYNTPDLYAVLDTHQVILSSAYHLPDPEDPAEVAVANETIDWYKDFVEPGDDPSEPVSDIYYPILDTTDEIIVKDPLEENIVGMFGISIYWRDMLKDILPQGSSLVVVIENECNPSFTYQINGEEAVYLGRGDLHDTAYDEMEESSWGFELSSLGESGSTYTGLPIKEDFCPYHYKVYPSKVMEERYTSNQPIVLTAATVLVFFFTAAVFIGYDAMVEYRQKKVMKTATKTSNVVNSLFPSQVRDRLFEEDEAANKTQTRSSVFKASNTAIEGMHKALMGDESSLMMEPRKQGRAIADLFQNTTIFFADIAGFTKWSSSRTPIEVFELLEHLYGAFDACAKKRNVFKVETIGDCYVAVTGLPEPQSDHAVRMVKFARDCMIRMSHMTNRLADSLGQDTLELGMRVGLHSGATTAGVLRGEKGRFQLFGDTVNTASRMESNGVKGRIHVSQETADLLTASGKGQWLTPREDKIEAKGKGLMQTYFVSTSVGSARTGRTSMTSMSQDSGPEGGVGSAQFPVETSLESNMNGEVITNNVEV